MTSPSTAQAGAPLGVGSIVSESFSILMRHFLSVMLLASVPTLIALVVSGSMIGFGVATGVADPTFDGAGSAILFVLSIIVQIAIYGITTALLVQLAYDAKLERPLQLGRYIGPAISAALPIAVLGLVSGILMALGLMALIIPGLWVYAVFSVMSAAVVIEKVGFGGLGRSAELTKEYRWPILGALIIVGIVGILINLVATFVVGLVVGGVGGIGAGIVVAVLVQTVISAIGVGLGAICIALIYARLREIKEGASVRDIAAVFE